MIEQQIIAILKANPIPQPYAWIELCDWDMSDMKVPFSLVVWEQDWIDLRTPIIYSLMKNVHSQVDQMIQDTPSAECLSSPIKYIRAAKKWFNEQDQLQDTSLSS